MNPLINDDQYEYYIEENKEQIENRTFGDIFAVFLISTYTLSAIIISGWSTFLMLTGNTDNGSPIGFIFSKFLSSLIA